MSTPTVFHEAKPLIVDKQRDNYRHASIKSSYTSDDGILVIPVMGPVGTPPVMARVHAPIGYRTTEYHASKQGSPPVYPAQYDTPSGDIMLSSSVEIPGPVEDSQGKLVFGVRTVYNFVQGLEYLEDGTLYRSGPRKTEDWFPLDKLPFLSMTDTLGAVDRQASGENQGGYNTWNAPLVDSRVLGSYRMIA